MLSKTIQVHLIHSHIHTLSPSLPPFFTQDNVYIEEMAHFDRERVPERVVHAKGAGMTSMYLLYRSLDGCLHSIIFGQLEIYFYQHIHVATMQRFEFPSKWLTPLPFASGPSFPFLQVLLVTLK